ncbi:purine nucleosidase [Runella defluvii]|uniref:Purine nucleosidase n=1 Tax=Runella defluvii TaxID=370973 RepID=A0A7W5ZIS3_9BACT|nr:nucleoside hydrolase [Runella defluvii]MBB3837608.1 purine nucleosidase [Runella defluvii]
MRHLLIDTDTGSDDAVALLMAMKSPDVKVEVITIVAGNVPADKALQNALYMVDLCQYETKVYLGAEKPLIRPLFTAQFVHGDDGMGDIGLDLKGRKPLEGHAVDAIIDTVNKFPNEIEIITLGPLTNMALALAKAPEIASKIKSCVIMGGVGFGYGNITPVSEYNIWVDPEAAQMVFQSGMNMTMVGWDISIKYAAFDQKATQELRNIQKPLADFVVDIQGAKARFTSEITGEIGFDLPDPITVAVALDRTVATDIKKLYVEVVLGEGLTRGQTIVDHTNILKLKPNMEVVLEASREKFLAQLYSSFD